MPHKSALVVDRRPGTFHVDLSKGPPVASQCDHWLPPERVIQEQEQGRSIEDLMSQPREPHGAAPGARGDVGLTSLRRALLGPRQGLATPVSSSSP